jgi:hypothetical protein
MLVLHMPVVVIGQGSSSDDFDKLVILYLIQLAFECFEGGEGVDFEMSQELVEVFLVLSIVNLWIYPVVGDLSSIFEAHLRQLFHEEVVLVLPIYICWQVRLF